MKIASLQPSFFFRRWSRQPLIVRQEPRDGVADATSRSTSSISKQGTTSSPRLPALSR
jgi:hypothetical protein